MLNKLWCKIKAITVKKLHLTNFSKNRMRNLSQKFWRMKMLKVGEQKTAGNFFIERKAYSNLTKRSKCRVITVLLIVWLFGICRGG
jgi:hypothetical protein